MKTLLERAKDWLTKLGYQMNDVITDCQHLRDKKDRLFVIPVYDADNAIGASKMPVDFVTEFNRLGDCTLVTFCEPKKADTLL